MAEKLNGGQIIAKLLKQEGVEVIFTLCGLHVAPIYQGCWEEGIEIIDFRHEQAAVHAADAYARQTGKPGIATVTAGPGVTDGLTGVANAYAAGSPVIFIGGSSPQITKGKGALQELDQIPMFKSITKMSVGLDHVERVYGTFSTALRTAMSPKMGPVYIDAPYDILMATCRAPKIEDNYRSSTRIVPEKSAMNHAIELIDESSKPVVIAGNSIAWNEGTASLLSFSEKVDAPVYVNGMARGHFPTDHRNFFQFSRRKGLGESDLTIIVGTPMDFRLGYGTAPLFPDGQKIIQIDDDLSVIGRNRGVELGLGGSCDLILQEFSDRCRAKKMPSDRRESLKAAEEKRITKLSPYFENNDRPMHPYRFCHEIAKWVDEDTIVIADGGNVIVALSKVLKIDQPGHWMDPGPLGCLGVGPSFAITCKYLYPDKKVLLVAGDGSIGFNGFDIDTAARFNLPFVTIIGNDQAWGQVRNPMMAMYGNDHVDMCELQGETHYHKLAEVFGGKGYRIEDPAEISSALDDAFASNKVSVINCLMDKEAMFKMGEGGYAI